MRVEEIIVSVIKADETISSLTDRVYPLRAAQSKTLPFITYTTRVEPNSNKNEKSLFDSYFIDIIIFSDRYSTLNTLADSVRSLFEAVDFVNDNVYVNFDFLTFREDYDNVGDIYNKTVSIIGHYYINQTEVQ